MDTLEWKFWPPFSCFFLQLGAYMCLFFYFGRANSSSSLWFVSCWVNQIICTKMYVCIFEYTHIWFFKCTFHDGMRLNAEEIAFLFCPWQAIVTPTFVCPLLVSGPRSFLKYIFCCAPTIRLVISRTNPLKKLLGSWYHWCHPRFAASNLALLGMWKLGGLISCNEMRES